MVFELFVSNEFKAKYWVIRNCVPGAVRKHSLRNAKQITTGKMRNDSAVLFHILPISNFRFPHFTHLKTHGKYRKLPKAAKS